MGVDKGLNTKHTFQWVATDDKSLLACAIKTQFYQRKECSFYYVYFNMGVLIVGGASEAVEETADTSGLKWKWLKSR